MTEQKSLGVALRCASKHLGVMCQNEPFLRFLLMGLVQGGESYVPGNEMLPLVGW